MARKQQELEAELESLHVRLDRARRVVRELEEQRSGYGLRVPVDLVTELEEKLAEVAELQEKIALLEAGREQGDRSGVEVPNNLPFAEKGEAFKQFAVRGSRFAVKTPPLSSSRSQSFAL